MTKPQINKNIEALNITLVAAQRRLAYMTARINGAMERVKARWEKAAKRQNSR